MKHPQLWLVFFGPGQKASVLERLLFPRAWRHVCCASYQPEINAWLYVNPARNRSYVLVLEPEAFNRFFGGLLATSTAILEVPVREDRLFQPIWGGCVGVVKGILGVRSWALSPYGFYCDLIARGAESFGADDVAEQAGAHGRNLRRRRTSSSSAGGSGSGASATNSGSAGGS